MWGTAKEGLALQVLVLLLHLDSLVALLLLPYRVSGPVASDPEIGQTDRRREPGSSLPITTGVFPSGVCSASAGSLAVAVPSIHLSIFARHGSIDFESAQLTFMQPSGTRVRLTQIVFFGHVGRYGMALLEAVMPCLFAGVPPH